MNSIKEVKKQTAKSDLEDQSVIERVQTGIKIEKRILKVLKGLAEYHDLTLGDLLEGIVLHAFDGNSPFGEESQKVISELKKIYKLDLDSSDSHHLLEMESSQQARKDKKDGITKEK